ENGKYKIEQFMVDNHMNNCLTDPNSRSLQATRKFSEIVENNKLCINASMIGNAFCLWTFKLLYDLISKN
ncbi:MAG: hypothetical protein K0R31_2439, partial [Clostridiales bacterium]|nr:hypothetical protein [Clostridiales bacterium]